MEKVSIGSSVPYCVKVVYVLKSNTGKRFFVPQTSTGIGSLGSPDQYWGKFYRFPSPVLGKVLGSPVHYWEIILASPVHAVLGKGSISSQVQYWEKVL